MMTYKGKLNKIKPGMIFRHVYGFGGKKAPLTYLIIEPCATKENRWKAWHLDRDVMVFEPPSFFTDYHWDDIWDLD